MRSGNHKEHGDALDLGLLTIWYRMCVSYPRRSGLVGRNGHSRPMYLNPILYLIEFTCMRSDELSRAVQFNQST